MQRNAEGISLVLPGSVVLFANSSWYLFNFRKELIRRLIADRYEVIAVSPIDEFTERLKQLGIKHVPIYLSPRSVNPLSELSTLAQLYKVIKLLRPRSVFSFTVKCNLYTGICRHFFRFGHVANISGLGEAFEKKKWLSLVVGSLYKIALRKTHKIFFQNREDLHYCIEKKLVSKERAERIPGSGVDIMRFQVTDKRLQPEQTVFLMFGRLIPQKGYDLYLEAARMISMMGIPNTRFLVMGIEDPSRPESVELKKRLVEGEKQGYLQCLPASDAVEEVLKEVDCVVLPSQYNEGVPRSLLEALASGKIIITTNWKGCRDTVEPGESGFLIDIGDSGQLVEAMLKVINLQPEVRERMIKRSRALAVDRFDERWVINSYLRELSPSPANDDLGNAGHGS